MEPTAAGGLGGLVVLDLSRGIAGSFASRLLANYGADVVKVERPDLRGSLRAAGPFAGAEPHPEKSLLFHYLNSGKRGLTLDLETAEGRAAFLGLAARADAVVEDLGPGVLAAAGLGHAALAAVQPRIVLTSLSPFGPEGPYSGLEAPNLVLHALDGQLAIGGNSDREPLRLGANLGEYMPGVMAAVLTAAALHGAARSGVGEQIDLSVAGTTLFTMHQTTAAAATGEWLGKGRAHPDRGFDRVACADGYVGVHALTMPAMWQALSRVMEMPVLQDGPPPGTAAAKAEWTRAVAPAIRERLRDRPRWDVFFEGLKVRLPFGIFLSAREILDLAPLHERKFFVALDHPVTGREIQPGAPVRMGDAASAFRATRPAPTLGQHNAELLAAPPDGAAPGRARSEPPAPGAPALPFAGLRVVDFTAGWAGPIAAQIMGFLGAEVIKVEAVQRLDWWRASGVDTSVPCWYERSPLYNSVNRNKRGITLDLKDPRGKAIFRRLADRADVLIDNYSTHVLPGLGLGYDVLRATNPGLIMAAAPAFGTTGSWRDFPGFGTNVEEIAGYSELTGYPGGPPEQYNASNLTDPLVGLYAAFGLAVAVRHRAATGRGQFIDVSHIEASATFLGEILMDCDQNGRTWPRMGNRHPEMAPHNCYRCAGEDEWVAIAVTGDDAFRGLCAAIGDPALAADARFAGLAGRKQHEDELDAIVGRWTATMAPREAERLLRAAGVTAAAVLTPAQVLDDPHFATTGHFEQIERAHVGRHAYPAFPARFSRRAMTTRTPAPTLGEHNREVLRDLLGLPAEEIAALERDRVIGTAPLP